MPRVASKGRPDPVYQQLADRLERMIQARSLRAGDRVPSVRRFSQQQGVSVPTALHAYVVLENRGLIEARPKSGFFVRARLSEQAPQPDVSNGSKRVTDFSQLDPLESVLADIGNPKLVPLGAAVPSSELLPAKKLAREMGTIARRLGASSANYDVAPGSRVLRSELARRSLEWGCALEPDDFVITNGCTEAVSLALQATCKRGDTIAVESPTYFGLARTIRQLGLCALPIPVDSSTGIDLDALRAAVDRRRIAACVLIPNFHNPIGFLMPDERKKELVLMMSGRNIPIIEDDIYGDLQHQGPRPRCVKAFDRDGSVILCGSVSKTLAPGYRVGYVSAGRWHDKVLRLKQTFSMANATLPSLTIAEFLRNGGYDRYLRTIRNAYRLQVERMRETVAGCFPDGVSMSRPEGNFVLWVELPRNVDSIDLFHRARSAGISIAPGPLFSPDGGFRNFIRLNCGQPWSLKIEQSVRTVGRLVHQLARSS